MYSYFVGLSSCVMQSSEVLIAVIQKVQEIFNLASHFVTIERPCVPICTVFFSCLFGNVS